MRTHRSSSPATGASDGHSAAFCGTFAASYETGIAALRELGYRAFTAQRLAQRWRAHEEALLEELGELWGKDEATYFERARAGMDEVERLLRQEDPTRVSHEHG